MNTAFTESNAQANTAVEVAGQYSLAKILVIWALAAVPMGILTWVVFPALSPDYNSDPLGAGVTRFVLLTLGLIWLFILSMIIVRQEGAISGGRRSSAGSASTRRAMSGPANLAAGYGYGSFRS